MGVVRHFAWFRRDTGRWLGEWKGELPAPDVDPLVLGDARLRVLNDWQHDVQADLVPVILPNGAVVFDADGKQQWDLGAWHACPPAGAVCLDVTRCGWPVGDHRWHVWDDAALDLDWPESSVHTFIRVRPDTLEVVGNNRSHRPVRAPGLLVLDITGTPLAEHYGHICGWFVRRGTRWGFRPLQEVAGRPLPRAERKAIAAAAADVIITRRRVAAEVRR